MPDKPGPNMEIHHQSQHTAFMRTMKKTIICTVDFEYLVTARLRHILL